MLSFQTAAIHQLLTSGRIGYNLPVDAFMDHLGVLQRDDYFYTKARRKGSKKRKAVRMERAS